VVQHIAGQLSCPINMVEQKLEAQKQHIQNLEAELKRLQAERSLSLIDSMLEAATDYPDFKLVIQEVPENTDLKAFGDALRSKLSDQIAVLLCPKSDKLSIQVVVGGAVSSRFHAGKIVSAIAASMGGKGGGRPDSAMAGCQNPGDTTPLIAQIPDIIRNMS